MLYDNKNYLIPILYLINTPIYEYDIHQANINILKSVGILSDYLYKYLSELPRMDRQIYIGNMIQKDKKINDILSSGIIEYKKKLFESNNINDNEIVSIKNDAVFITRRLDNTVFDIIEFRLKNSYTLFMKIQNLEIYFGMDSVNDQITFDIKGIADKKIPLFFPGFGDLVIDILISFSKEHPKDTVSLIQDIYNKYIEYQYPIEFYRTMDMDAKYVVRVNQNIYTFSDTRSIADKKFLNISRNVNILSQLLGYSLEIYNMMLVRI